MCSPRSRTSTRRTAALVALVALLLPGCHPDPPWEGRLTGGPPPCAHELDWHVGPASRPSEPGWVGASHPPGCPQGELRVRWADGTLSRHPTSTWGTVVHHTRRDLVAFSLTAPAGGGTCTTLRLVVATREQVEWTEPCGGG